MLELLHDGDERERLVTAGGRPGRDTLAAYRPGDDEGGTGDRTLAAYRAAVAGDDSRSHREGLPRRRPAAGSNRDEVLVLCPHYAPDMAPTGEVMTRIADELVDRGHQLHVVTSLPWYRDHRVEPGWTGRPVRHEDTGGRASPGSTRSPPTSGTSPPGPWASPASPGWPARWRSRGRRGHRPDVVLAMSPPLTLGAAGWLAAQRWRVPFVFNIQDVFPDVAVELGAITNRSVIRFASWLERWTYRRADAVTVLSDDLRDNLVAKLQGSVPDPV